MINKFLIRKYSWWCYQHFILNSNEFWNLYLSDCWNVFIVHLFKSHHSWVRQVHWGLRFFLFCFSRYCVCVCVRVYLIDVMVGCVVYCTVHITHIYRQNRASKQENRKMEKERNQIQIVASDNNNNNKNFHCSEYLVPNGTNTLTYTKTDKQKKIRTVHFVKLGIKNTPYVGENVRVWNPNVEEAMLQMSQKLVWQIC